MLLRAIFTPHPPVLIPSIGKKALAKVQKTVRALEKLQTKLTKDNPETIILVSPHGPHSPSGFPVLASEALEGNFGNYGDPSIVATFQNDAYLLSMIEKRTSAAGLSLDQLRDPFLDHGTLVPLHYLLTNLPRTKLIPFGYFDTNRQTNFQFGQVLGKTLKEADTNAVFVASGDLSHRLTKEASEGFSPKAKEFDEIVIKAIKKKDPQPILDMDQTLIEEAGQCGLNSLIILLGILQNFDYKIDILSYETPFGVGYLTVDFEIIRPS